MKTCIIIPARLASSRLPNKVLADINGKPMILRVYENCINSKCGDVFVATDSEEVKKIIENAGGKAIMTNPSLPSGTDRINAALQIIDPSKNYSKIINVQGDVPNISTEVISSTSALMEKTNADITTPITLIKSLEKASKPNVVKAIVSFKDQNYGRALYFTRTVSPFGEGDFYEHIGLYVYSRKALETFVSLKPSTLEKRESLEQLRALENDMKIFVNLVDFEPISVDTPEDLEFAKKIFFLDI